MTTSTPLSFEVSHDLLADLVAPVPVDRFYIVNGPHRTECRRAQQRLGELTVPNPLLARYVPLCFNLMTDASGAAFERNVPIATIFNVQPNGMFEFTALFYRRVVSGVYSPQLENGWFNLD